MNVFLILAFLFFIGSVFGWFLELFYRRFISSANPERKWINPGFCTGPYVPLYGSGLCILYLIATLEQEHLIDDRGWNKAVLFLTMAVCMTVIEYIAGIVTLKYFNLRLWDYRNEWGNIQGIICPKFSLIWAGLGALYYFLIHPRILKALYWLSENLAFSFFIGLFFGVFILDVANSAQIVARIKRYAQENDVIVRYEMLKAQIEKRRREAQLDYRFFAPFHTEHPLSELLHELRDDLETRIRK